MSSSLVRKALLDMEAEEEKELMKKHPRTSSEQGLKLRKQQKRKATLKLKTSVKDLKMKCVLDEFKSKRNEDMTDDNLAFLQKISNIATADSAVVQKVIHHQTGRKGEKPKKKVEEKSVFTEEDFAKFEKEYFVKW